MPLFSYSSPWPSDEHRLFSESARRFMDAEMAPKIEQWIEHGVVERAFWNRAGDAGLMGGAVEESYGGFGGDIGFDAITIYEQAFTGDFGWGYGIQSIVTHYIRAFGTEAQKQRWLPKLVSGEYVGALAMTEPGCGSDVKSIRTTALPNGSGFELNGSKIFITNGQSADLIVVAAKTEPGAGSRGVSLVVLETADAQGFRRGRSLKKLGMKASDTAELFFDSVFIPGQNLLGEEGGGFYQLMGQLPWERLLIGITALGAIDFALAETTRYVQERKAFGQRLMDLQNTRFKLAEIKTQAEILRAFLNDCMVRLLDGNLDAETAAMAKWWGSETQNKVMHECLQLHGGYGYMLEYPIARMYADARVQMIYGGANEIMKELIARSMD